MIPSRNWSLAAYLLIRCLIGMFAIFGFLGWSLGLLHLPHTCP